jgi:hypothetical protein
MSDELRLGFHRLGQRLEDPVNLGVALAFLWAIFAWVIGVAVAMGFLQVLLLALVGIALIVILRGEISELSARMTLSHRRLEQSHTDGAAA